MDASQRNIAALFNDVGRPVDVSDISKRKLAQKIVYLGQALGLPTHYSFNWYIHGPYSPALTKDYYSLTAQPGEADVHFVLRPEYQPIAERVDQLLNNRPQELSEPDWAELLASVVFLRNESQYDWKKIKETIDQKKGNLSPYFNRAKKALAGVIS